MVSFLYAFNDALHHIPLWNYFLSLSNTSLPWCLLGDFSCVVSLDEISGGREHWTPDMQVFKDCLSNSGLGQVRTVGKVFTWTNKRAQSPILKRLDRMVANAHWFNIFTEGNAFIKTRSILDHNPIYYEEPMQLQKFGKPFQYFNFMADVPGFHDLIAKGWTLEVSGSPVTRFTAKLEHTKILLQDFKKSHGNVSTNVQVLRAKLQDV